jgi:glyoxylate/hydroxypyruvate reductase
MTRPTILLWLDEAPVYERALAEAGLGERVRTVAAPREAVPDASLLAEAEAVLAWGAPAGIFREMPRLRWVQSQTVAMDAWLARDDLDPAVALTCARGVHRVQMPENILGAMLHVTRPFRIAAEDQKQARWVRRVSEPLAGRTLAILGLGAVGRELAKKAAALEMRVVGMKRDADPVPHVDRVFPPSEIDILLGEADFVVVLLPLTPETTELIDRSRLAAMKPTAWLLNFARGAVIVDEDLVAAVEAGTIRGAVLDVFRKEPLPAEHPFWRTDGIIVLPHIGGLHPDRDAFVAELFVDNVARFLDGRPLQALVDRARGY